MAADRTEMLQLTEYIDELHTALAGIERLSDHVIHSGRNRLTENLLRLTHILSTPRKER